MPMEALDPRITGEGRTGPDRKLDLRSEIEMIGDYRAGLKISKILGKHSVSNWLFNETLKRHGIVRTRRRKQETPVSAGA